MIKKLLYITLVLATACQHVERPEKPDDLIAKDKMVDILTDIYISNAAKSVNNKVIRQKGLKLDSLIYAKYNIDSVQFVRSHAYYNADLNGYNEIFKNIEERLEAMLEKADSSGVNPGDKFNKKQDSLKNVRELIPPPDSE
jgi:hypothetical protein